MWPFTLSSSTTTSPQTDSLRTSFSTTSQPPPDLSTDVSTATLSSITLANPESAPHTITTHNSRLSTPFPLRIPFATMASFTAGFALGAAVGSTKSSYRYRAENAHRMPTTPTGWFLYQKSKNYHSMLGGMKEGVKMGGVLAGWTTLFFVTEEVIDSARMGLFEDERQRDVGSTVIAAMSTAGAYSWKKGMDRFTAAKTARLALKWSAVLGLVQDGVASLRGVPPAYVQWVVNRTWGRVTSGEKENEKE